MPALGRPRRSCLAVPGSSVKMLEKAQGLPADQVFLDLEDAVAPLAKPPARQNIVAALTGGDWGGKTRAVRVNDLTTPWTYRDVIEVVEGAGEHLDCVMLPKVQDATQVQWLDLLLTQIEKALGLEVGRLGIEAQIENAAGLVNVDAIAERRPRRDGHLRPGRLHGLHQYAVAGRRRAHPGLPGRSLPLHPHAHPHGRPDARQAGDRRAVPADPRRRGVPRGGPAQRRARLRRQVGAAPGPDRGGQRDLLALARRTTTTPS